MLRVTTLDYISVRLPSTLHSTKAGFFNWWSQHGFLSHVSRFGLAIALQWWILQQTNWKCVPSVLHYSWYF